MPIVDVELVGSGPLAPDLPAVLAKRLALVFGGAASGTWVKIRRLDASHYGEGDGGPGPDVLPVFVSIVRADMPSDSDLGSEISKVVDVVADACRRPAENIHVIYEPAARGRIAFGGTIVG